MILRRADGLHPIYDIGNNAIFVGYPMVQVGTDWQFAGVGGFQVGDTADMLLRSASTGGFEVYDISTTTSRTPRFLATSASIGRSWASAISQAAAKPT